MEEEPERTDFEGIVLNFNDSFPNGITNFVLLLTLHRKDFVSKKIIFGVHETAFKIEEDIFMSYPNFDISKHMARKAAEPLEFGSFIRWNIGDFDKKTRIIHKFHRASPVYECKNGNQIKVSGVLSPETTMFWSPIFVVPVIPFNVKNAEPNITLEAWIQISLTGKEVENVKVELKLVEFHGFQIEEQNLVAQAPWNKDSKFSFLKFRNDPDIEEFDIAVSQPKDQVRPQDKWEEKLFKQRGLFVGNRQVFSKSLSQYDFIVPFLKPITHTEGKSIYPQSGEYVIVNAEWSELHECFLVTSLQLDRAIGNHPTNSLGEIQTAVVPSVIIKGLFTDCNGLLGFIDDPEGHLVFIEFFPLFSRGFSSKVEIRPVRASENKSVRFRIVRPVQDDDIMKEYKHWLRTTTFTFENIPGVLVDNETIVSTKFPNVFFKFNSNEDNQILKFNIGAKLKFNATHYPGYEREMIVTQCSLLLPKTPSITSIVERYIPPVLEKKSNIIKVVLLLDKNNPQLAHNDLLGLVDLRQFVINSKSETIEAWVMMSPTIRGCRRACSFFEVISIEKHAPEGVPGKSAASKVESRNGSAINEINESQTSRGTMRSSVSSAKFSGPAFRKGPKND